MNKLFLLSFLLFSGCVFAPSKCGGRGVVTPEYAQYHAYLKNCRNNSSVVDHACKKWGDPTVIKIGHSGGYLVWNEPRVFLKVGSFYSVTTYMQIPKIPKDILPYLDNANELATKEARDADANKKDIPNDAKKLQRVDTFDQQYEQLQNQKNNGEISEEEFNNRVLKLLENK